MAHSIYAAAHGSINEVIVRTSASGGDYFSSKPGSFMMTNEIQLTFETAEALHKQLGKALAEIRARRKANR